MSNYEFLGGDTIKVIGRFKDYDDNLVDPTSLQLKIYNSQFKLVDSVTEDAIVRDSLGVFHTKYQLANINSPLDLIFEWYGIIQDKPSLERTWVSIKFVQGR